MKPEEFDKKIRADTIFLFSTKEIKILKKCGLKVEGRLKKAGQIDNKLYDLMILGIFKENKRG